jgi:hypothetical protein
MSFRDLSLRLLGLFLFAGATVAACGGSQFSAGETGGTGGTTGESGAPATGGTGGTAAGGGTGGAGGTAGGGTTLCSQASDCDDEKPCTLDTCTGAGVCEHAPLCPEGQLCCDGVCSECCGAADCNDLKTCTDDVCFAGFCTNPPNAECEASEVCGDTGCVPREGCVPGDPCDDGNPCTTDACVAGFCDNAVCPDGGVCCENTGCGTCCIDAQCASEDANPCTLNVCENGQCAVEARCEPGELCCPSADGQSATCGACCTAMDCPDDGVPCTASVCTRDGCKNQVTPGSCAEDETCDLVQGCIGGADCEVPSDCTAPMDPCDTVSCDGSGSCVYGSVVCPNDQVCCSNVSMVDATHCRGCCDNSDCANNGVNTLCCQADGACHQCCQDSDCGLAVAQKAAPPIVGGSCIVPVCSQGLCGSKPLCGNDQVCCNGACYPAGTPCVDPAF